MKKNIEKKELTCLNSSTIIMISKEVKMIFGLIWEHSSTLAMMTKQECSMIVSIMSQSGFLSSFHGHIAIRGLIQECSSTLAMTEKQECSVIVSIMSQSGFLSSLNGHIAIGTILLFRICWRWRMGQWILLHHWWKDNNSKKKERELKIARIIKKMEEDDVGKDLYRV